MYTAGTKIYIDEILKFVDPNSELFDDVLARGQCSTDCQRYYKDLFLIENRKIENMLIVDDDIGFWPRNIDNLVPVAPYYGEKEDSVLNDLLEYLQSFISVKNCIEHNRKWLRLRDLIH